LFKILAGKCDVSLASILHQNNNSVTRVNSLKLHTYRPTYDLCTYNFRVRVTSLWNSLPDSMISAVSVNSFKNRLNRLWATDEARFSYKVWQRNWKKLAVLFCCLLTCTLA